MFYSETLLAKTGPLARVWLAANLDRKLSKQNVLSSDVETNVKDIIGQGQAPMALRLTGQLLLGVVKIYSRKAQYLFDDCSDALHKIKLAFRPGQVDLPSNQPRTANPSHLIVPDSVAEIDLFAPLPDPEDLLRDEPDVRAGGHDPTLLPEFSQPLADTPRRRTGQDFPLDDDDLGLDFGLEPGERSIEVGRRAQTPRQDDPTFLGDMDLGLDFGDEDDTTLRRVASHGPTSEGDLPMADVDDGFQPMPVDDAAAEQKSAAKGGPQDDNLPLSPRDANSEHELEKSFQPDQSTTIGDTDDLTLVQAAQRVKRRKVMRQDNETQLHNSQIKRQQEDRSAITKQPTFLPRDPLLLQLMEMQRNGTFASTIMGDGRMAGWAPELRGILSLEFVTRAGEKKRKRDSGIADMDTNGERQETPRLMIPEDDEDLPGAAGGGFADTTFGGSDPAALPGSDDFQAGRLEDDDMNAGSPGAPFDITEAPVLHPSQSGPVSVGTKNAVHLLREHFAPDHPRSAAEPPTPSKRVQAEALFTDLCPQRVTSRQNATKMFFELLVLGTKDAVKVEQDSKEIGLPIRVRGKRGLWGDWAEAGAGGEIATQASQPAAQV